MGQIEADKIRILYVHHAAGWGGAIINLVNIIQNLDHNKYDIKVLLIKNSIVTEKLAARNISWMLCESWFYKKFYKYYIHTIPNRLSIFNLRRQLRMVLSWLGSRYIFAAKELNNLDFDVIHLNSSVLTDWLLPSKKMGKKVILHIQEPLATGLFGIRYRFLRKQMQKYADKIIAISKDNAQRVNVIGKTTVVYNFTEIATKKPLEKSYYSRQFLYVGGTSEIKGFYTMVDALPLLHNDIEVIFIGDFNYKHIGFGKVLKKNRRKLRAIKKIEKSKNARIVGEVDNIKPYLDEACCLISPFLITHFSRPIIEAYANFKTVIATNVEGINEEVSNGIDGIIIEDNSWHSLASSMNNLSENPSLIFHMSVKGHEKSQKMFSTENIQKIVNIYENELFES